MKILLITLLFYFSILQNPGLFAATSTIVSNYPAPGGSYNKIVLGNIAAGATPVCSTGITNAPINTGLIFVDPGTNNLTLCATTISGGTTIGIKVPYYQVCFNRFWDISAGAAIPNGCPAGYTASAYGNDTFSSDGGAPKAYSTTCCSNGSILLKTS